MCMCKLLYKLQFYNICVDANVLILTWPIANLRACVDFACGL